MASFFPTLTYRDAPAAIAFLKAAFGFEERMVVPGEDGTIAHAELGFGDDVVMLGTVRDGDLARTPGAGSTYVVIDDPDARFTRAVEAGARVLLEPFDTDYGSRDFAVADPEGNLWFFGTYRPGEAS